MKPLPYTVFETFFLTHSGSRIMNIMNIMSIMITLNLSVFAFCSSFDSVRLEEKRWWKQTFGVELTDLENTFPHMSPTPSARSHIDRGQYGGLSDSDIKTIPFSELKQKIASFDQDTQINIKLPKKSPQDRLKPFKDNVVKVFLTSS